MREMAVRHEILTFVLLTALISLVAGVLAFRVGGPETFSSARALPLLLAAIWAPNVSALLCAHAQGKTGSLLRGFSMGAPILVWLLALAPLTLALALGLRLGVSESLPVRGWLVLIAMNAIMGPLGEELGWRGYLLPRLVPALGTVGAAIALGAIWALWHLPLWYLPSPQSSIPFPLFAASVVCFSVIMAGLWAAASGALWPIVTFHLAINVGIGWMEIATPLAGAQIFRATLPFYVAGALVSAVWLGLQTRGVCAARGR
jgi:membrane protease YdiL (CAAX protease family)